MGYYFHSQFICSIMNASPFMLSVSEKDVSDPPPLLTKSAAFEVHVINFL